jgi:hypothetical protein
MMDNAGGEYLFEKKVLSPRAPSPKNLQDKGIVFIKKNCKQRYTKD